MNAFWSVRLGCKARVFVCLMLLCAASQPLAGSGGASDEFPVIEATAIPLPDAPVASLSPIDVDTIYQNETPNFFWVTGNFPTALEDLTLSAAGVLIDSIEFGFRVNQFTGLRVEIRFWDGFNPSASPVHSDLMGGVTYNFGSLAPGQYITAPLVIPGVISPNDGTIAVQFDFLNAPATMGFGGGGVTVGSSPNRFYLDFNTDGQFDANEWAFFAETPPTLANFWLHMRRDPNVQRIDPGIDLFTTPAGGATWSSFSATPIPADFFAPGSLPFTGDIVFKGEPLNANPPGGIFPTDTIVRRLERADLTGPGSSDTVPIEIVALSLVSVQPITVMHSGPPFSDLWDVSVCLSQTPAPIGSMTIEKGTCEGGTFTSTLFVQPRLTFTNRDNPSIQRVLDTGIMGLPPIELTTTGGHWLDHDPGLGLVVQPGPIEVLPACGPPLPVFPAPTTPFFPGVRIARCDGNCATPGHPAKRLTREESMLAAHGVLPTQQPPPDLDGDGFGDDADNCPQIPNPLQQDTDDDTVGDLCDNCPSVCNVGQLDTDADNRGDACELAEVPHIDVLGGALSPLAWSQVPEADAYDILVSSRGSLGPGTQCLRKDFPANNLDDATIPAPTEIRYYLPRAADDLGAGAWGYSSAGVEILSGVCGAEGRNCRDAISFLTATVPAPAPGAAVTFCSPAADCVAGGSALSQSRASDKLCQDVYGATCVTNDDCPGANGCCADKVTGTDLTLGACAIVAPDTCPGTDVPCDCSYAVPPDPAPPSIGFRCDCVCQVGGCPAP